MKIAIIAPSPIPYTTGGAEYLYRGMQDAIKKYSPHQCELIKIPVSESNFWEIIESYYIFYTTDLSSFDMIISTKYPSWMTSHQNHILFMVHHLRGLFDTYHFFNKPEITPENLLTGEIEKIVHVLRKKIILKEDVDLLFTLLFRLKLSASEYPRELFEFPGPFIREIIHFLDRFALAPDKIKKYFTMSNTVKNRRDYFPEDVFIKVIYPPPANESFFSNEYSYLFTASRLDGPKRIDLLIDAMKFVPYQIPLIIAGTGPEHERLKNKAASDARICFLGFVNDSQLIKYYANGLAVLFVPYDEDYGFITIEAMKSRKPVITASDSGGPLEFIENGQTGFVVPPNPACIAEKINFLIENKQSAREIGNQAYEKVNTITWEKFTHKLLNLNKTDTPKMRILVLSTYSCYPPRGGGQQRLFNIYSRLAEKYDVTICSIVESHKPSEYLVLKNGLRQISIPQSSEHAELQWNQERKLGKNLFDCCMIDLVERSPQYVNEVKNRIAKSDIVIFSHPYLFPLKKYINNNLKIIYEAHNVEFLLKRTYLNNGDWDIRLYSNEKQCCDDSHLIFTTSGEDKAVLHNQFKVNSEKIVIAPNGVDTYQIQYIPYDKKIEQKNLCNLNNNSTILFVGSWHPPNLEALKFIISELLPGLKNAKLLLVGSIKDYYLSKVGKLPKSVLAFGIVDELEKYEIYKLADVAINPMFTGSGTNIKMLDYFSAGIPVVTTETGARGIPIEHKKEAIICSAGTMLKSIQQLLADRDLQNHLRRNARSLVESKYSWEQIVTDIEDHIEHLK